MAIKQEGKNFSHYITNVLSLIEFADQQFGDPEQRSYDSKTLALSRASQSLRLGKVMFLEACQRYCPCSIIVVDTPAPEKVFRTSLCRLSLKKIAPIVQMLNYQR